jgi:hypothetical protein
MVLTKRKTHKRKYIQHGRTLEFGAAADQMARMHQQWLVHQENCAVAVPWEYSPLIANVASVESLGHNARKMHHNFLSQIVL